MTQQSPRPQLTETGVSTGPAYVWSAPGKALAVRLPFELIDRLERLAVENFRSIEARGSEIGGLLFGAPDPDAPGQVRIEDFAPIVCDYSRGPFFRLSDADLTRVDQAIAERGGLANARVAGFFRSHSRKGLLLDAEDMKVIEARFREPWQIALLVRPFATKVSAGGIFIWEDGRMRGDASYLEFPFRSSELTAGESRAAGSEASAGMSIPAPKPLPRAAVAPMPSRLRVVRPPAPPPAAEPPAAAPAPEPEAVAPIQSAAVKPPDPPEPAADPAAAKSEAEPPKRGMARKLLWGAVAAGLLACSGTLFLYPGLFRRAPKPPAALSLRIEHTATDLLLTWNRDSEAVRNASKAVLSITDGDRQENLTMNLADLRNGSVVYSPLTADVSFHMEVIGPDQSKTASESVRVLRTKPSPMPAADANAPTPPRQPAAPQAADQAASAADEAQSEAAADEQPAARRAPVRTFNVASLAERLRPALPTDLPVAPDLSGEPAASGSVNLGVLAPSSPAVARPASPAANALPTPEAGGEIRQAQLISRVNPVYPDLARQQRITGSVTVKIVIGTDGKIRSATAASGPELLRRAAVDAVKQWVYSPMTMNGRPVETEKQIDVNFSFR
jgi:protein TonB